MVKITVKPDDYEVIDHIVAEVMYQPKVIGLRFKELFGRLNGSTKEFYEKFINDAASDARAELFKKSEAIGANAIFNIDIKTNLRDIRGDVFISATAQAIALRAKKDI